jgi:hypothetical protein
LEQYWNNIGTILEQYWNNIGIMFTIMPALLKIIICNSKGKDAKATARKVVHYKLKKSISIVKDYILFIYFI